MPLPRSRSPTSFRLHERRNVGDSLADNHLIQPLDPVVGQHRLEASGMPHHRLVQVYAVGAQRCAALAATLTASQTLLSFPSSPHRWRMCRRFRAGRTRTGVR
jgi:hypothetical protein